MSDITMCKGQMLEITCQRKESCYRFTAIPNEYRQSYYSVAPLIIDENKQQQCSHYSKTI